MPNRIIKESIRTSYEIDSLSVEAEITFYRLLTFADDFGRFQGDPRVLQSSLFPLRPSIRQADFTRWVAELAKADLIRLYTDEGKPYGYFPSWEKHQNRRAKESKYPEPNGENHQSLDELMKAAEAERKQMISDDITCNQTISDAPVLDTRTRNSKLELESARTREGPSDSLERVNGSPVPESLQDPPVLEMYGFYLKYYRENYGRPKSSTETQMDLHKLTELQHEGNDPVKVIQQTIQASNKSFYELRDKAFSKKEKSTSNYETMPFS